MEIDVSKGFELGGFHYEVKNNKEIEEELDATGCYGKCDNRHKIAKITTAFGIDQFSNTFIHECIEAVDFMSCSGKIKHEEVNNLANGLSQIMKSLGVRFVFVQADEQNK